MVIVSRLIVVVIAAALGQIVASGTAASATITPVQGNVSSVTQTVTFVQYDAPWIFATVQRESELANTAALYDPGAPYVAEPMLPVVTFGTLEHINTGGVNWATSRDVSVVGFASLNPHLVYFGQATGSDPYHLTCNWLPAAEQCWRAQPDWLLSGTETLQATWSTSASIPWAVLSNGSGGTSHLWW